MKNWRLFRGVALASFNRVPLSDILFHFYIYVCLRACVYCFHVPPVSYFFSSHFNSNAKRLVNF